MSYRILGLDDDNHQPVFVAETGNRYHGYRDIINYLAEPHLEPVEVKMFAIVDGWEEYEPLGLFDEETVDMMFDMLGGLIDFPEGLSFDECFELFWNSANRKWW